MNNPYVIEALFSLGLITTGIITVGLVALLPEIIGFRPLTKSRQRENFVAHQETLKAFSPIKPIFAKIKANRPVFRNSRPGAVKQMPSSAYLALAEADEDLSIHEILYAD